MFESYRSTQQLLDTVQRVWFTENDQHRKKGALCVGHTKCYTKVTVPFEEGLLGTIVLMKITDCLKWHIEGTILEKNLTPEKVDPDYFDPSRQILLNKKKAPKKKKKIGEETQQKLKELVDLDGDSECEEDLDSESESVSNLFFLFRSFFFI